MRLFKAVVLPLMCFAITASCYADTQTSGGSIHFRGAIVEGGCVTNMQQQSLAITCPQDQKMQTQHIHFFGSNAQTLPPQVAQVQMRYLNPQQSMAVIAITYN